MAAEARTDVHHCAPSCLLGLFDAAAGDLADCSEFEAEAERLSIEVRRLSREELTTLIEGSTRQISTMEHRRLHQEARDFVRWGMREDEDSWPSSAGLTSRCSSASDGGASN